MYGILEPPTIATSELHSHLEQQAQSVAPQIELVAATISVERLGLTRNASSTPYIVYRVKERRCCTFFKRDRKSTRLNSSHSGESRMPSSA